VLAVLNGESAPLTATRTAIPLTELIEAAARYQAAGRAALTTHQPIDDWYQITVAFPDRDVAEHTMATRIGPKLRHAETSGIVESWWYIRKTPHWRLRFRAGNTAASIPGPLAVTRAIAHRRQQLRQFVADTFDELASQRLATTWSAGIYEPETWAFGGTDGMEIAHRFFHTDSTNILTYLDSATPPHDPPPAPLGRRELTLLLCTTLLRAAGQDWHEQGDVWQRVALMRPPFQAAPDQQLRRMTDKVRRILATDTQQTPAPTNSHDPLDPIQPWLAAAKTTGEALRNLAYTGTLRRGLRDVLAHHVIFHWNRLGLATTTQTVLACTAAAATLETTLATAPRESDHPDKAAT